MLNMGSELVDSGLLPHNIRTPQAAVAIILKGRELGIQAMYAMSSINVIKGKPTASAELMLALIYRDHGDQAIDFIESSNERCTVAFKRRQAKQARQFSFSMEDARAGDLLQNDTWRKYPAAMLRARCISAVARMAFPDTIAGMYTPEELGADVEVDEDGQVVVVVGEPEPIQQEPQRDPFSVTRWLEWVNGGPKDGKMAEPAAMDAYETWCLDWDSVIDRSGASTSVVNWITNGAGWKTLTAYQLKALKLTLTSDRFTQPDREQIQAAAQVYAEQTAAPASEKQSNLEAFKAAIDEVPL